MRIPVIEETAVVLSCDNSEFAYVEVHPKSSCGGCSASGVCGTAALSKVFGNKPTVTRVYNTLGVKPGVRVVIGIHEKALSRISVMFYLVPLIALIILALLGQSLATWLGFTAQEPFTILSGLVGLMVGLYLTRRFSERVNRDERYQPVMLRYADSSTVELGDDHTIHI